MTTRDSGGRRGHAAPPQAQFALDGFAPNVPTDNLFFAIFPHSTAQARIADVARETGARHALRGDPLRTDRFHITLLHLGDHAGVPPDIVAGATRAAAQIDATVFDVVFDRVGSFAGGASKPCVLLGPDGDSPLRDFQRALCARLAAVGLGRYVRRDFTPHVTLRYAEVSLPAEAVAPVRWSVREFVLVDSLAGQTEYRILGRWPLRD
ncbi:MAG TPA: 2'-5' RNA ligase family protein [Dokdonella sp.]